MLEWLKSRWFESRTLSVLQVHYEQPLKKPLPPIEAGMLRGVVELTIRDGGTPFDAATRFYAAFAGEAVGKGVSLNDIAFGTVLGRLSAFRAQTRFYDEHVANLKGVSQSVSTLSN